MEHRLALLKSENKKLLENTDTQRQSRPEVSFLSLGESKER